MNRQESLRVLMEKKRGAKSPQRRKENSTEIHLHESEVSDTRLGGNGDNMAGKKNLLIESMPVTLSLVEGRQDGKIIARGEFGRVGVPTDNGRIYPKGLMEREIKRLSEDLSKRKVLGELDHPCLTSSDFRVLTATGWKAFRDVQPGERVWSRKDGRAYLSIVKGIVDEPYAGPVYHVHGRSIDSTFTPAHRAVVSYRPGEERYKDRQDELIPMADIAANPGRYAHSAIPRTAEWPSVESADTVVIPAIQDVAGRRRNNDVSVPLELPSDVFAAFMGLYLSEGSCAVVGRESYNVFIHQKLEWSREFIKSEVLDRFPDGLEWSEEDHGFRLCDARLWGYLEPLGNAYEKYVPEDVKRLSPEYLREFVFWFGVGDGRMVASNSKASLGIADDVTGKEVLAESLRNGAVTNVRFDVFSVSERLISDLHECVVKSGRACSHSVVHPDQDYMFAGREIKAENKVPLHQLHIANTSHIWLDPRFLRIEEEQYDGNIYCLSVDGGNFYMEQNGHAFWTGNSDGKTSLKRVSHVITGLTIKPDGIVVGEAEILNTREGKNLKALIEANVQVAVSSRGFGSTAPSRGAHEGEEVQEDFVLKTYDFVADPAVKSAVPGIYTEDVDDPTLAKMFLDEFPEVAESIKGADGEALTEESGKRVERANLEKEVAEKLTERFERKLKEALLEQRGEVETEIREIYEGDPEIAGAKGILAVIAEMVGAYAATPDEQAVRDAMKAKDLEMAEAVAEATKASEIAKRATFALHVERKIGGHPLAETIRNMMKGREFSSIKEVDETLKAVFDDLPNKEDIVTKEEAETRVENADLRGQIALLESKVEEMNVKAKKAVKLGQRIDEQRISELEEATSAIEELEAKLAEARADAVTAQSEANNSVVVINEELEAERLKVYKLEKVAGLPNGRELLGLMETVQDRRVVDELVKKSGRQQMRDPLLNQMIKNQKGKVSDNLILNEEDLDSGPNPSDVTSMGYDMDEMAALSGIEEGSAKI